MASHVDSSTTVALTGSCQCGEVKLKSNSLPLSITLCHCTQCRRMGGGPFMPFGDFGSDSISWTGKTTDSRPPIRTEASQVQKSGVPIAYRGSCSNCGSPLWMKYSCEPDCTGVAMGVIDDESVKGQLPKPKKHIFLQEKASWWEMLDDGLERYQTCGDGFSEIMRKWEEDGCPKRSDVD